MKKLCIVLPVLLLLLISGVAGASFHTTKTFFRMDTVFTIDAKGFGSSGAADLAMSRAAEIEARMSAHTDTSDLNTGLLHDDTRHVIETGLAYFEKSDGLFDITVRPLSELWFSNEQVPLPESVDSAVALVDASKVQVEGNRLVIPSGMALDLGGIAKGYAADEAARILAERGIKDAVVNFGGNIVALGRKRIGVQSPFAATGCYMAVLEIEECAVSTSGSYQRYFEQDGVIYHHILDPDTGYPADSGVVSATVVADAAMDADAMSTILFMMGKDGLQFIEESGAKGFVITNDKKVYATPGLAMTLTDTTYVMEETTNE